MKDREYYEFIEDLNYYRFGLNYASSTLEPEDELMLQIVKAGEISELYKVSNFRKSIQKRFKYWNVRRDRKLLESSNSSYFHAYKHFVKRHPLK